MKKEKKEAKPVAYVNGKPVRTKKELIDHVKKGHIPGLTYTKENKNERS